MDSGQKRSAGILLYTHTVLLRTYSRLGALRSVAATLSEMLVCVLAVGAGSGLAESLKVITSMLMIAGVTAALSSAAVHVIIPQGVDVLRLLRQTIYTTSSSPILEAQSNVPGLNASLRSLESGLNDASEWFGWMLPLMIVMSIIFIAVLVTWAGPGGSAWSATRVKLSKKLKIAPGPVGIPVFGCSREMQGNAHRKLASLALKHDAQKLMAFSVGCTRIVITSDPIVARDMLIGSSFSERPLKEAAEKLLFARAMGFAAPGPYWRQLRRIAATSLFCPKRILAHQQIRQEETTEMLQALKCAASDPSAPQDACSNHPVRLRSFLQRAAVNNMMRVVFGRRYDFGECVSEAERLERMIRDCFDVLGAFNWADHFPGLRYLDMLGVASKCKTLVPRVQAFVQRIIADHRNRSAAQGGVLDESSEQDFVDVLLALEGEDKLSDSDMISVLWELIFRGTDTIAVLTEWALAELILHPEWQTKIQAEMDDVVGSERAVEDADIEKLPSLQAALKETLRAHPPGPLLSWARLATEDVKLGGFDVPRGTTAMVNMWAITHDPKIWAAPFEFNPGRFMTKDEFDVRGGDLRLAPFGAGRRVCPGRSLGLATSYLWLARLLHEFTWSQSSAHVIDLSEDLKLSCEMASPLYAVPRIRRPSHGR